MKSEIEAKFLDIDLDEIRGKLKDCGGVCEQPMRLMRRVTIETEDMIAKNAYVRVRDEGNRVTITYKQFERLSIDGAKEIETTVGDFDDAVTLLGVAGLPYRSFQESKRETWKMGNVEVVLDEWPWLKPYIEIEGPTKVAVRQISDSLALDWDNAVFGDVMVAYRAEYPHLSLTDTIGRIPLVRFGDPLPELLISKRKQGI